MRERANEECRRREETRHLNTRDERERERARERDRERDRETHVASDNLSLNLQPCEARP